MPLCQEALGRATLVQVLKGCSVVAWRSQPYILIAMTQFVWIHSACQNAISISMLTLDSMPS